MIQLWWLKYILSKDSEEVRQTTPIVKGGRLYQSESEGDPIAVGTPGWYDWLERHNSFTFVNRLGAFTVHKSDINPSDLDWKASRTNMGRLFSVSLGPSRALTLSRLQDAARKLAGKYAPAKSTLHSPDKPAAATPPVPKTAATVGPTGSLVHTKLSRPRSGSDVITRTRLIERLNAGLGGSVTLISAPAGYGKTTLLVEWLQASDRPSAWLSLDANDNELLIFVHSLTAALQTIFPDAFQSTASLLKAPLFPPANHVATLLLNDLADVPEDIILVLDDYHLIHTSEVHTLLDLLIRHLSPQLHLVLATRSDPPLPLARWRAKGYLNELRSADLRCTLEETEAFLTRVLGSVEVHETAGVLEELTEGWFAVLRLAALSLRSAADHAAFMERLRSYPDRSMNRYLVEEILAQQTPAVQELLERTSILEQFCAELCVAVVGSDTSYEQAQATLDWLERSNLLLVTLDERRGWFRFHHLFQQLLQKQLQAHNSQEEVATLHRRASVWYAEQGLIEEAIEHALAAGDAREAAQLVEAQFLWAFEQEQLAQMERWLRLLPEEQIQGSPGLLFARVWILQAHGQLNNLPRLLTDAGQLLDTGDSAADGLDDPRSRLSRALIAIGWSQFHYFTGQAQASLESARSALQWLPPGDEHVTSYALLFLAWSYQATGQEDVAHVALQQALRDQLTHLTSAARLLWNTLRDTYSGWHGRLIWHGVKILPTGC